MTCSSTKRQTFTRINSANWLFRIHRPKFFLTAVGVTVMWEFRYSLVSVWTALEASCKRSENKLAEGANGITIPLLYITCLNGPMGQGQRCCWRGSGLMIYCVCLCVCVLERKREDSALKACLFARKLSVCAAPETSTLPTLHNLVSSPPLINFTAAFPEGLWSDACGVDSPAPAITTTTMPGKYVLENTAANMRGPLQISIWWRFRFTSVLESEDCHSICNLQAVKIVLHKLNDAATNKYSHKYNSVVFIGNSN